MAEYTNPNFFSEDTINAANFPYPRIADQTPVVERPAPTGGYTRQYYLKNCCGETNGGQGYLLAAVDWLDYYRKKYPLLSIGLPKIPVLDDNIYADYASHLIPRAVGYSAGLINYFFRGEVEVSEVTQQSTNQAITGLKFKVKNLTPEEAMQDGQVWIAYRYKPSGDPNWKYGLSDPIPSGSVPYQGEAPYEVTFPTSIPADATDFQYTYVFKGTLGQEVGAVVGKVLDLIWEDWERGLTGRHRWIIPAGASVEVTAATVPNPTGPPDDAVAEFQVTTHVRWYGDLYVALLSLSGTEGPDQVLSTEEFGTVETAFYLKTPPFAQFFLFVQVSLLDPLTGASTRRELIPCFYQCEKNRWLWTRRGLPPGYVVKGVHIGLWLDTSSYLTSPFQEIDFLVHDIRFLKR